jgi:hypothetical protein
LDLTIFPYGGYISLAMREEFPAVLSEETTRRVECTIAGAKVRVKGFTVRFHGIVLMNLQAPQKKGNGVNTEKVTARRLTADEVSELGLQDGIFVSAEMNGLPLDSYAPAFLTKPGKNFEGGSFTARTIFGEEIHILPDNVEERGIWIADKAGEQIEVLQSAGVLLNLALFVPDGNKESLESLYSAAREAFGAGIVQRWSEETVAVPDVKVDLYEEPARGRKNTNSQNRDRRALDIYPTRVRFLEPSDGWRFIVEPHKEIVDDTPTI